ncbi:MAG: chorismate mutase [Bacillota bacterium]
MQRVLRAIRGAVCAEANSAQAIERASRELVLAISEANGIGPEDVLSAVFTATPDLNAQFPAVGARQAGWTGVALLCAQEMAVPSPVKRCVRVLVHAYLPVGRQARHVYLGEAAVLRPDWASPSNGHA